MSRPGNKPIKGRGAMHNPANHYESLHTESFFHHEDHKGHKACISEPGKNQMDGTQSSQRSAETAEDSM